MVRNGEVFLCYSHARPRCLHPSVDRWEPDTKRCLTAIILLPTRHITAHGTYVLHACHLPAWITAGSLQCMLGAGGPPLFNSCFYRNEGGKNTHGESCRVSKNNHSAVCEFSDLVLNYLIASIIRSHGSRINA